jgi:hypothetical protein
MENRKEVNYQTLTDTALQRWLPDSTGIASNKTEVLPARLTSPPQAEALVPNARIRKASFLILMLHLHHGHGEYHNAYKSMLLHQA